MRAYFFLGFIFLGIKKKEQFLILSLESTTSTINNHKPAKGSLSSNQLFVTSLHSKNKGGRGRGGGGEMFLFSMKICFFMMQLVNLLTNKNNLKVIF